MLVRRVKEFLEGEGAGTAIEYIPITALIAFVLVALFVAGSEVSDTFTAIGNAAGQ